ncbi:MAG: hypothetical protein OQK94_12335 [Gammaproteobacteria bacterium]|nr:hypothetical protein [Gammaproteobacteria bacterium]MCW8840356.1 hypothetical protein [Gammaproteobacteria bacterium]MCW8928498.1 hypothetical protein [Gammaproteobacteria bacterium]MCW8957528.1 hypothetical protein [Gammaproteobacteria bacterium]MCW8972773.1 hypothetical protein [Gammaproteobacteria bacterium]
MLRPLLLLLLLSSFLLLLAGCAAAPPHADGRQLSGEEIEQLFSGHSFTLIGMKSGNELLVYSDAEHCTMRYVNGTRTKKLRWYTEGDQHCCVRDGKPMCGAIYDQGQGIYHKFTDGRHSHTMKDFTAGNRL